MLRQVILDTETTGLSVDQGHRLIEIGCIELCHRSFTNAKFHHYIDPEREIDPGAQKVHGITREFLIGKPKFYEIAQDFIDFIAGAELIIHNADFDVGFLNHELARLGKYKKIEHYCKVLDTLKLARKKHPGQKNNLDALCKRYQVDASSRQFHGALLDAQILGDVYLAMTAGQMNFLAVPESASQASMGQEKRAERIFSEKLPLITATHDEAQEHAAFLEKLRKKSKKVVHDW